MLLFHGATQSSSDKKIITCLAAAARYSAVSFNKTSDANRNRRGPGRAAQFAADYTDFELLRGSTQSAIKRLHPFDFRLLRGNQSNQRKFGHGRCCGEIAEWTHHRLPTNLERVRRWQEMHA